MTTLVRTFIVTGIAVSLMLTPPRLASAQSNEKLAANLQFSRWVGDWKGTGWSINAAGERTEFRLVESVREKAGGRVLLVEGHGTRTSGAAAGMTSHDGLVLVYRDTTGRLHWNGHEAASGMVDADITLVEHGFVWSFKAGAGGTIVRFAITLTEDEWQEVGDVSGEGKAWTRFMEMTLQRTPAGSF